MNRTFDLVAISPWLAPSLQPADAPKRIPAAEAGAHVGQSVVVTGRVAELAVREKTIYLNLDKPFPDTPFMAVVFARKAGEFGDLQKLEGRTIEVSGKIVKYRDRPEIVVDEASQLKVLDG